MSTTVSRALGFAALAATHLWMPALAQDAKPETTPVQAQAKPRAPDAQAFQLPPSHTTEHAIVLAGQTLNYKATAGGLTLPGAKGEPGAQIFYTAYVVDNKAGRPVTFAFNGGPGAASAFLQFGALGPRVVPFKDNGAEAVRPLQLADNPDTWLAFTDLVFVDPVGTGYSRVPGGGPDAEKAYWNVDKDAQSVADFIRLYLAQNGRGLQPIFLAGESYGGFRAALLTDRLLSMGLQLKGAIMISPALEFSVLRGSRFDPLPLVFALPSIAASHYEMSGGLSQNLPGIREEVETFARSQYLLHLISGAKRDDAVNQALAKYTGLDTKLIARHHGQVPSWLYVEEHKRLTDRGLSRYDGTVSVPLPKPGENTDYDPILDGAVTVLEPAAVSYFRQDLGFKTDLEYRLLNRGINAQWDFGIKHQGFAGSLNALEDARTRNPALKVMVMHGYTDLVTPFAMSRYLIDQLRPIEGAANVEMKVYPGGHMMYLRPASRAMITADARTLFDEALAAR